MKWIFTLPFLLLALCFNCDAQTRIDSTLAFQTDPSKDFGIFIPSSYDENEPAKLMVAMHPWNTSRWNSESWCDTLIVFAETNNLFLVCPDGGSDGQISDPIDTAFTTLLIDEMQNWYNIDSSNIFLMGFSWGGQVTYSYGLNNTNVFKGFMPIGAAINGTNEFNNVLSEAEDQRFYLVHGSTDSPNTRYYPALDSITNNNACVNSLLMPGVGHTIDFANRNEILSEAFTWLDTVSCGPMIIDTTDMPIDTTGMNMDTTNMDTLVNILDIEFASDNIALYPNPVLNMKMFTIALNNSATILKSVLIYNLRGQLIIERNQNLKSHQLSIDGLPTGEYIVKVITENNLHYFERLMVF